MSSTANIPGVQGRQPFKLEPVEVDSRPTTQHALPAVRPSPGTPRSLKQGVISSPASAQRRASSTSQSRPGSSASPRLMRKPSRSSIGNSSPRPDDHDDNRPTPKRSISNLITELRGAHATMEPIPEPVILTAPQIAQATFTRELAGHEDAAAKTIVLLHDACYGHRFSRLKTSKGTLSMIVERPERILASVLGVAGTYVRLGGYHAGAQNAPHPKRLPESPPPFKIRRTNRTLDLRSTYVTNVHGTDWMTELNTMCDVAEKRLTAQEKEIARIEDRSGKDKRSLHEGDLYLCKESLDAFQGALGGVADAVDAVFDPASSVSRAFVAVRPPGHHCSADHPSGFCWINNVHVGIEYAAQAHGLTHAAIIDFDLHHGDGSQSIAWERNSSNNYKRLYAKANSKLKLAPDIGYYSLHDINSYPCEMGDDEKVQAASLCVHNAHGQSIWNVHLQPWKTLDEFWELYETRYLILLEKAKEFLKHHTARIILEGKQRPKSAIFISAGFDASEWEGEGMQRHKVSVPTEFYARFTADIAKIAETAGTSCDGRIISVLEGGYSDRALFSSTMSHLCALSSHPEPEVVQIPGGLGSSMLSGTPANDLNQRMSSLTLTNGHGATYDTKWWSEDNLIALEHHVNPPPPVSAGGKKARVGPQPTYATPTESFAYKVIDPAKFARSVSGTMREGVMPARPLTPPPPEVDWIVATHELSKLLIPTNRTTTSCTADELAGVKVKKERASDIGVSISPDDLEGPRQLRTRGKPSAARKVSNSDRRKTMADLPSIAADIEPLPTPRRPSRRSSMASTISTTSTLHDLSAPPVPALPSGTAAARPVPSRVPSDGMQIKKTRTPAVPPAPKPKVARPRSPAKKTAAPLVVKSASPAQTDLSSPIDTEVASVDALATGMKRITLKVGTREENDKRAKEKLDADRRARALKAAETRRINKAAKEQKAAAEKQNTGSITTNATSEPVPMAEHAPQSNGAASAQPLLPASKNVANLPGDSTSPSVSILAQDSELLLPGQGTNMPMTKGQRPPHLGGGLYGNQYDPRAPQNMQHSGGDSHSNMLQMYQHAQPHAAHTPHAQQTMPVWSSTGHIPFAHPELIRRREEMQKLIKGQMQLEHQADHTSNPEQPCSAAVDVLAGIAPETKEDSSYDVWAVPGTPGP